MTKEIILEVGAEGGTLTLFGSKDATNAWKFWTETDETATYELLDEEDRASLGSPVNKSEFVNTISEGLALLDKNPWFRLIPLQIHPEFRDAILSEVRKRSTADEARWNERLGLTQMHSVIGGPIIFDEDPKNRRFRRPTGISTRRDDTNFFEEELLQELLREAPDLLPVREFLRSTSALFHLGREVPVDIGGEGDGSIDNLLVTNDGYLVIVETKLYRNPEAIRKVVAQILQYCMAVSRMSLLELETSIRQGQNAGLKHDESIRDCVSRLATANQVSSPSLADDFEDALEKHLRRGEVLLLVVTDSIRIGVERLTDWLNGQGSSLPFKFGIVELRFYALGNQRLVIPRAVLKTQEVSRYVVAVDIHPSAEVNITASVTDDFQSATGGKRQESRPIKVASVPLTKGTLLQLLSPEDREAASRVIEQLEILKFEPQGTPATLKFGFTSDDGEFHSLVILDKTGAWVGPFKKDADRLGPDTMLAFRNGVNHFAPFYRKDQLNAPGGFGCAGKYRKLEESAAPFAAFLDGYRTKIMERLEPAD